MNYPDNWERVESEYNKNYDPYDDNEEIEEEEDGDRSEDDGSSQK